MNVELLNKTRFRYLVVGAIGAFVELILFSVFLSKKFGIAYSHFLAFHFAFVLCFVLHYFFTYENLTFKKAVFLSTFIKYVALMYTSFFFGALVLWLLIEKGQVSNHLAKLFQLALVIPLSYLIQKYVIFKK